MGFPISAELGKLTMDVLVADCCHYKTPSYDGVCMNIVTKSGFGRTILCAIAIIPIENSNHICWVLQMCLRLGLDLKYTIFTDQGPILVAAALFNEHIQILLKLQLCLQHIIRCIRRLHLALFRTKKDNTRLSPAAGENKSEATKNTGNSNDKIVRRMVHKASYAISCSEFFNIIYDSIQLLVDKNPTLCGDIMDIGIYLLEFHLHLWTLVANLSHFSQDNYLLLLKPLYYEFMLTKHCFCQHPEGQTDIKIMGATFFNAYRMAKTGCEKFEFHKIISEPTSAPRFNNSTTNTSELMAWVMKSNSSRWSIIPQFVRQCIHLYNPQMRQMIHDYDRYKKLR